MQDPLESLDAEPTAEPIPMREGVQDLGDVALFEITGRLNADLRNYAQDFAERVHLAIGRSRDPNAATARVFEMLSLGNFSPQIIKAATPLVRISSLGGETRGSFAAHEYLRDLPCEVIAQGIGSVHSAALTIYSAGDVRLATPHTQFMFHESSVGMSGPVKKVRSGLREFELHDRAIAEMIARACGQSVRKVLNDLRRERHMSAEEAKAYGLVTDIVESVSFNPVFTVKYGWPVAGKSNGKDEE